MFLRLGVADVFNGLSWQRTNNSAIKKNLEVLNIVRSQIARGAPHLTVNQASCSLSLAEVVRFRNFADAFGNRFEHHVASFIP